MGVSAGPDIIEDGLVLSLDAADKNSYPGSGTVWRDLSGNNNSGSLVNGPTFNSDNLGSIVFDGTNDYVDFSSFPSQTQISCEAWVKIDTTNIAGSFVAGWVMGVELQYRLLYSPEGFSWVCRGQNSWYSPGTAILYDHSSSISNTWFNVVGTYNGSYNSLYVDGLLVTTGSAISGNVNGGNFVIGKGIANVAYQKGNGPVYRIYNRALSATEVLQNYNATKARFGL